MSTRENLEREASSASEKLHEAGETLKSQAQGAVDQAKTTVASYAEQGAGVAASSLGDFADAVRKAADKLNDRDQGLAARLVSQAADGLEQAASSVSGASLDDVMGSVQRFARQNPAAFVGVAVLAGIALGRFAKASSERTHVDQQDFSTTTGYRSGGYGSAAGSGGYGASGGASGGSVRGTTSTGTMARGTQPNPLSGSMAGTPSAGRPMVPGTGGAAGRSTVGPASSLPNE